MNHKRNQRILSVDALIPGLAILAVISVASVLVVQALGGVERARVLVAAAGVWAPVVFVALKASTYVIAPLSGAPIILMAGAVFGVWEGLALIVAGEMLGASLNFWIGRTLGRPGIKRLGGAGTIRKVDQAVRHVGGWRALLVASVLLSSIYDFISYAAGLSNLPYRQFFWVSLAGIIPMGLLGVFVGDRLVSGYAMMWVMAAAVMLLVFLVWNYRRRHHF